MNWMLLLCPSKLSADWSFGSVTLITHLLDLRNILTLVFFVGLLVFMVVVTVSFIRKAKPKFQSLTLFAALLMLIPFIPASNLFFPVGFVVAERVLYIPSMGFCMLVGLGLSKLLKYDRWNCLLNVAIIATLTLHATKTVHRNRDWVSNSNLFSAAIKIVPNNSKVYTCLADEYNTVQRDFFTAEVLYTKSLQMEPTNLQATLNFGSMLAANVGRPQQAEQVILKE